MGLVETNVGEVQLQPGARTGIEGGGQLGSLHSELDGVERIAWEAAAGGGRGRQARHHQRRGASAGDGESPDRSGQRKAPVPALPLVAIGRSSQHPVASAQAERGIGGGRAYQSTEVHRQPEEGDQLLAIGRIATQDRLEVALLVHGVQALLQRAAQIRHGVPPPARVPSGSDRGWREPGAASNEWRPAGGA